VDVSSPGRAATFLREVRVQSRTRHPNVLPFYGACVDPPDRCWILTTLCHGGTLKQWLYPKGVDNGTKRPLAARLRIAHELARALRCLEESSPRLIHRDVKPSNLFMSSDADDATAYLADFGLAREIRGGEADATEARETLNSNPNSSSPPPKPSSEDVMTGETGTYVYMAPEVVRHERYDAKADVYSFGATLVELVNGAPPYREYFQTPVQIAFAVADGKLRPELKAAASRACPGIAAVAQECVARDPTSRPSFAKIVDAFDAMLPEVLAALEKGSKDASGGGISAMFKGLFG
jgi:serine/threonine protein kinase